MPRGLIDADLSSIVPSSKDWANGNVSYWISMIGTLEHMIGYGELFWPDFIEHDDCILKREAVDEESYRDWLSRFEGDKQAVESMINHVDLIYLVENPDDNEQTDEQRSYLGRLLREMWQAKLARQFPERNLVVELSDEPEGEPLITVYQRRSLEDQIKIQ